jgi:hypothetical protein
MQAAAGPVGQGRLSHEPRWLLKGSACGTRQMRQWRSRLPGTRHLPPEVSLLREGMRAQPGRRQPSSPKEMALPARTCSTRRRISSPPPCGPTFFPSASRRARQSIPEKCGLPARDRVRAGPWRSTRPSGNAVSASQDKGDVLPGQRFQDLVQIDRGGRQAAAPLPSVLSLQEGDLLNGIVMPEVAAGGLHPLPFRVSGDQARPSSWLPGLHGSSQRCPELLGVVQE